MEFQTIIVILFTSVELCLKTLKKCNNNFNQFCKDSKKNQQNVNEQNLSVSKATSYIQIKEWDIVKL